MLDMARLLEKHRLWSIGQAREDQVDAPGLRGPAPTVERQVRKLPAQLATARWRGVVDRNN